MVSAQYVIIGASAAAVGAINRLRQLQPGASIAVVFQEKEFPYNKCLLADFAAGAKSAEDLAIITPAIAQDSAITFYSGVTVTKILPEQNKLLLNDGRSVSYTHLLLTMGSSPAVSFFFEKGRSNLFFFHTLADVNRLLAQKSKKAVVIGAGLSGLECADALNKQGIAVTLIERQLHLLPTALTPQAAVFIQRYAEQQGIRIIYQAVNELKITDNTITSVTTDDGTIFDTDMVILATGLKPNSELAQHAGIMCYESSVMVNEHLQTSIKNIYAAGDLVVVKDQITGNLVRSTTWPDAMMQGGYAAFAMVGQPKSYPGIVPLVSSSFFGLTCAAAGVLDWPDAKNLEQETDLSYTRYVLDQENRLKGFIVIGVSVSWSSARRALLTQQPFV